MMADIEFFGNDLTLGFRDRFGDQWGSSSDWGYFLGDGNGDIKCASWDEGSGTYIMEHNGICGSRQAKGAPRGPGRGDDPGSELYWGEGDNETLGPGNEFEDEYSMGALAQFGTEPLAATQIDLSICFGHTSYDVGGIIWHDNLLGTPLRGYGVYDSRDDQGTFRKANGLGDLEALCEPVPH